jgi:short subunit dehydrogenase-like uncharacterized protein
VDLKTILILGGYGNTGRPLARLLLMETNVNLLLAGRNITLAQTHAQELNLEFGVNRVRGIRMDVSKQQELKDACSQADFVVMASSTTQYTQLVAQAALEAKIGYLDIQYSPSKIAYLRSIEEDIRQAGCCFITEGGFHPGLPALLVRYAALHLDQLESANVGSVIKEDWKRLTVADSTVYELVEMINDFDMSIYKAGEWKKVSLISTTEYLKMDFGAEYGKQTCAPMLLEEMRGLPGIFPTLRDTGFYVGSFNWFTDWVIMPISMIALKLFPHTALKPMSRWMYWGLKTFSRPPFGTMLKVEASGKKDGKSRNFAMTASHPDGYFFTAAPVAACLLQYLDGSIDHPGLLLQALAVEPVRFMQDLQRMGIAMKIMDGV